MWRECRCEGQQEEEGERLLLVWGRPPEKGRLEQCLEGLREWGWAERERNVTSRGGGVGDLGFLPVGMRAVIDVFLGGVPGGARRDAGWSVVTERAAWRGRPSRVAGLKVPEVWPGSLFIT